MMEMSRWMTMMRTAKVEWLCWKVTRSEVAIDSR
jgi:hypothetical protein